MAKRILITGGTGYLGSRLVFRLLDSGYSLSIVKRPDSNLDRLQKIKHLVDFFDTDDLNALHHYDIFIHAATSYGRRGETRRQIKESNIYLPARIIQKILSDNLCFINVGTSLPPSLNDYSETKHEFIEHIRNTYPKLKTLNILLEQFYGPNDGTFISFLLDKFRAKAPYIEMTLGEQLRDFVYISDVIDAFDAVIRHADQFESGYHELSLGSGECHSVRNITLLARELMNADQTTIDWGAIPYRKNEPMKMCSHNQRLNQLGWRPKVSLREGLLRVISETGGALAD